METAPFGDVRLTFALADAPRRRSLEADGGQLRFPGGETVRGVVVVGQGHEFVLLALLDAPGWNLLGCYRLGASWSVFGVDFWFVVRLMEKRWKVRYREGFGVWRCRGTVMCVFEKSGWEEAGNSKGL